MSATWTGLALFVLALLLQVTGVLAFPWWAWVVLWLAAGSGVALDMVRRQHS